MDNTKFTKGKWEARLKGQIASAVYCDNTQICMRAKSTTEAKADMLLISKAPEMLEMLKYSVEVIKWYMENSTTELHEPFFNIGANQIEQTEELIRKATEDQK